MRLIASSVTLALCLGIAVSGCSRIKYQRGYLADQDMLASVQPGVDNRDSVEKMLGRPSVASTFDESAWYYVSQTAEQFAFRIPKPKEHKVTAVRFDDAGNVIAVETYGLDDMVKVNPRDDETPTRGKEVSFFQELFSNIGRFGGTPQGPRGGGPN